MLDGNWIYGLLVVLVFWWVWNNITVRSPSDKNKINRVMNDRNLIIKVPIDLNGTDQYATFIGTKKGKDDQLWIRSSENDGRWVDIIDQTNLSSTLATYSVAAADVNSNGLTDLVVTREDGVSVYLNQGKGRFIPTKVSNLTDPVSSLAITDYNKDGHVDIYLSRLNGRNVLLEGVGRGVFEDVTDLTGTAGSTSEGRRSVKANWIDVNGDKLPDLVIGMDSGGTEIFRNTRGASGGKFISGPQFFQMKDSEKTLTEQLNSIAVENQVLADGLAGMPGIGKGVQGLPDGTRNLGSNWIGVRLPDNNQFMNAKISVVSVNQETGRTRRQTKQNVRQPDSSKVVKFNIGNDDRIMHLEVNTIYDGNRWIHPEPKINKIATFRDMKSNYYTARGN